MGNRADDGGTGYQGNKPAPKPKAKPAPPKPKAKPPGGISAGDWNLVQQVARQHGIDPYVLLSIGIHETEWGTTGAGRNGYTLGVGVYDVGNINSAYHGLSAQLQGAAKILDRYGVKTIKDLASGALAPVNGKIRYAKDPGWTQGVVTAYNAIKGGNWKVNTNGQPGGGSGLSQADLEGSFGFSSAFFGTDPSLQGIVNKAIDEGVTDANVFLGMLKGTAWWKKHTEAQRQFLINQVDDPAQWKRTQAVTAHEIQQQANALGVVLSKSELAQFTHDSLYNGLSMQQIQQGLAAHLTYKRGQDWGGLAGVTEADLKQAAHDMGIKLAPGNIAAWAKQMLEGNKTTDTWTSYLRDLAKSAFPALSQQLDKGMTVKQVFDPYVQQMSANLEMDPNSIDFASDPLIRKAASFQADPKAEPTLMPLWQFDQTSKEDPRWLHTDNARNSLMDVTSGILQDWGISF